MIPFASVAPCKTGVSPVTKGTTPTEKKTKTPTKMKTNTRKETLAKIRAALNVKRLDPRRLYVVDDGAYTWIGDRADLTAQDARDLAAINDRGCRPDRNGPETADGVDYDAICNRVSCLAASHNSAGIVSWESIPDDWRDGSALGEIAPL